MLLLCTFLTATGCRHQDHYDRIIRNGLIYNGMGGIPYHADIGINADTISAIGDLSTAAATAVTDAKGMAVAPGFINMLSQAQESLMADGRAQSDIRQGVTLEVMGEGTSMGPVTSKMKRQMEDIEGDIRYKVSWNSLGDYLKLLEKKGVSCNIASFLGAGTVRTYVIGEDNRTPTPVELQQMQELVKQAMQEGAMGISSALIYPPDGFLPKLMN